LIDQSDNERTSISNHPSIGQTLRTTDNFRLILMIVFNTSQANTDREGEGRDREEAGHGHSNEVVTLIHDKSLPPATLKRDPSESTPSNELYTTMSWAPGHNKWPNAHRAPASYYTVDHHDVVARKFQKHGNIVENCNWYGEDRIVQENIIKCTGRNVQPHFIGSKQIQATTAVFYQFGKRLWDLNFHQGPSNNNRRLWPTELQIVKKMLLNHPCKQYDTAENVKYL